MTLSYLGMVEGETVIISRPTHTGSDLAGIYVPEVQSIVSAKALYRPIEEKALSRSSLNQTIHCDTRATWAGIPDNTLSPRRRPGVRSCSRPFPISASHGPQ